MEIYRFSPINTKEELIEAVNYVASQTSALAQKAVGRSFPVKSLTVFAHYPEEYENLIKILLGLGKLHDENNGPRVKLFEPIRAGENQIIYLRIRKPDPERPQVGCNDFETDYEVFKKQYLAAHSNNFRLIKRQNYEMIEFFSPNFDVLAYVISKPI